MSDSDDSFENELSLRQEEERIINDLKTLNSKDITPETIYDLAIKIKSLLDRADQEEFSAVGNKRIKLDVGTNLMTYLGLLQLTCAKENNLDVVKQLVFSDLYRLVASRKKQVLSKKSRRDVYFTNLVKEKVLKNSVQPEGPVVQQPIRNALNLQEEEEGQTRLSVLRDNVSRPSTGDPRDISFVVPAPTADDTILAPLQPAPAPNSTLLGFSLPSISGQGDPQITAPHVELPLDPQTPILPSPAPPPDEQPAPADRPLVMPSSLRRPPEENVENEPSSNIRPVDVNRQPEQDIPARAATPAVAVTTPIPESTPRLSQAALFEQELEFRSPQIANLSQSAILAEAPGVTETTPVVQQPLQTPVSEPAVVPEVSPQTLPDSDILQQLEPIPVSQMMPRPTRRSHLGAERDFDQEIMIPNYPQRAIYLNNNQNFSRRIWGRQVINLSRFISPVARLFTNPTTSFATTLPRGMIGRTLNEQYRRHLTVQVETSVTAPRVSARIPPSVIMPQGLPEVPTTRAESVRVVQDSFLFGRNVTLEETLGVAGCGLVEPPVACLASVSAVSNADVPQTITEQPITPGSILGATEEGPLATLAENLARAASTVTSTSAPVQAPIAPVTSDFSGSVPAVPLLMPPALAESILPVTTSVTTVTAMVSDSVPAVSCSTELAPNVTLSTAMPRTSIGPTTTSLSIPNVAAGGVVDPTVEQVASAQMQAINEADVQAVPPAVEPIVGQISDNLVPIIMGDSLQLPVDHTLQPATPEPLRTLIPVMQVQESTFPSGAPPQVQNLTEQAESSNRAPRREFHDAELVQEFLENHWSTADSISLSALAGQEASKSDKVALVLTLLRLNKRNLVRFYKNGDELWLTGFEYQHVVQMRAAGRE